MSKIILDTETFTVPLDRLVRDPANVRVADRDADIAALAHNIAHEGLLQNLGVRPVLDSGQPTDRYSVAIGGRRHAALKYLVKAKRLPKDAPIRCSLVKNEAVTSAGASENLQRIAMHPADAYAAFAKMSDDGLSDAEIAVRFSITPQTVQKRLRLGRLSPKLLDALRTNGMTEQVAQAFAITTDSEAQERVFDRLQGRGSIDPRMVRSILTEGEVPALDRRVRFVGLAAYEAAGGAVRRDLFSDGLEGVTLLDPAKLDDLVLAKLEIAAADLRTAGWRNVRVAIEEPEEQRHFRPAPYTRISLSDEDAAKLAALTEEYETFEDIYEDELTEDQVARHDAIEAEMDAIQAREDQYDDTTKAAATVFVYLDYHGPRTYFGVRSDFGDGDHVRGDGDVNANGDTEEDGNEEAEEFGTAADPGRRRQARLVRCPHGGIAGASHGRATSTGDGTARPCVTVGGPKPPAGWQLSTLRCQDQRPRPLPQSRMPHHQRNEGGPDAGGRDGPPWSAPAGPTRRCAALAAVPHRFRGDRCPGAVGRQHDRRRDRGLVTARPVIPGRPDRPSGRGEYVRLLDTRRGELFRAHHQGADRASGA